MTRRIILAIVAATSLVFIAFMIPIWRLSSLWPDAQLKTKVTLEATPLASQVGWIPRAEADAKVKLFNTRTAHPMTVYFAGQPPIGDTTRPQDEVVTKLLRESTNFGSFFVEAAGGQELLIPVSTSTGDVAVMQVFIPDSELAGQIREARIRFGLLGLALAALSIGVGVMLARSFLRPVKDLAATAEQLATGDLSARVTPGGPKEIAQVGIQLNRLAGRVEELLSLQREEVADMAHRLRTPITALRLDAEGLGPESSERIANDVAMLERMVNDLIREARRPIREGAGAGCDATEVVRERAAFWEVLAEDQERAVSVALPSTPLLVRASDADLADAIDALIGNIFSHTDDGVAYRIALTERPGGGAIIEVADSGPGFPEGHVPERGKSGGSSTGLGMDIARRTAVNSGGSFRIGRSREGGASVILEMGPPGSFTAPRVPEDRKPTAEREA